MARHLFDKVTTGAVQIQIDQRFALKDVSAAHRSLERRQTTGSTVLTI
jgi:NADPH2:quinone reductase